MVQGVADDGVLLVQQGFEQPAIGIEAGGIEDGLLHAEKAGDGLFQLLVKILRAADEPNGGKSESVILQRLVGGGQDLGMVGQAQVVVGAEIQDIAPRRHPNMGALRADDDALFLEQRILPDAIDLRRQALLQRHGLPSISLQPLPAQFQAQTTLPHWPLAIRSKPFWNSTIGMWWVSTGRRSRPPNTIWVILYQVSNISRP